MDCDLRPITKGRIDNLLQGQEPTVDVEYLVCQESLAKRLAMSELEPDPCPDVKSDGITRLAHSGILHNKVDNL